MARGKPKLQAYYIFDSFDPAKNTIENSLFDKLSFIMLQVKRGFVTFGCQFSLTNGLLLLTMSM